MVIDIGTDSSCKTYSEAEGWQTFPSLPGSRIGHCQVSNGSDTFVTGGIWTGLNTVHATVWRISDGDSSWTTLPPLNTARFHHACAFLGGKLYAIAGAGGRHPWPSLHSVEIYDPEANSWTFGPEMPKVLSYINAIVHQDVLYVFGGIPSGVATPMIAIYKLTADSKTWEFVDEVKLVRGRGIDPAFTIDTLYNCK